MKTTVNLYNELIAANRRVIASDNAILAKQEALSAETDKLVERALANADAAYEAEKTAVMTTLGLTYKLAEAERVATTRSKWAHLPQERIFSTDSIRAICIKHNLRFLPTKYYKGVLDSGIPGALEALRGKNGGALPTTTTPTYDHVGRRTGTQCGTFFHIAAPAESFAPQPRPPADPLLFCDVGDNHHYLVHRWGADLSAWRSITKFWRWLCVPVVIVSIAIATYLLFINYPAYIDKNEDGLSSLVAATIIAGGIIAGGFGVGACLTCGQKRSNNINWDSPYHD